MDRRKFIEQGMRWGLTGGLFTMSGFLLYRRNDADQDNCTYQPVCTHCDIFSKCKKPVKQKRMQDGERKK
jgi:hypothetical protein